MDRARIESLLEHPLGEPHAAVMPGFTTVTFEWTYPVMIPDDGASVEGIVWCGLTDHDLIILDRYEGCDVPVPVYQREKHKIMIGDREEEVWAYSGTPAYIAEICRIKETENAKK